MINRMNWRVDNNPKRTLLKILLLLSVVSWGNAADQAHTEQTIANTLSVQGIMIKAYEKSSFAPVRGESFVIPIEVKKADQIKKLAIEIHTADNELVRTLSLNTFDADKTNYELHWDGRDNEKQLVPDEAYMLVLVVTDKQDRVKRIDFRASSGGEEVYDFDKSIHPGRIEYSLPVTSRVLIRSGIKNGPMLRTIVDWEPRTVGFHAERWNGRDLDDVIAIQQNPHVGYLIIGYQLPDHSIITYDNRKETYRAYRERKQWSLKQADYKDQLLDRAGTLIRPEFYLPLLQQKSPRITVKMLDKASRKPITRIQGMDEVLTEVKIHPLDEVYLDQERYEISFFVDDEFIAEEEQGFVPFTWRWSPGRFGLEPGQHILTINVSGYRGQVGVRNQVFTLEPEEKPLKK